MSENTKRPFGIAVTNQMGGAGKTTTAINVAGALGELGHDVLVVDADPQGTLSEGVGFGDHYTADTLSLYDVLTDLDRTDAMGELVLEHEEFDVIPANIAMHRLGRDLVVNVPQAEARLRTALEGLEHSYEYVVIDSPPHYGQVSDNCILAARNVLIPAQAKRRSVRALEILGEQIERLERGYTVDVTRLGIVVNETDHPLDGDQAEMLEWFEELPLPVWEIRSRVKIRRAWNNGVSIFAHREECDQEEAYLEIARALEDRRTNS